MAKMYMIFLGKWVVSEKREISIQLNCRVGNQADLDPKSGFSPNNCVNLGTFLYHSTSQFPLL